jgi:hypothetical protein
MMLLTDLCELEKRLLLEKENMYLASDRSLSL